MVVSEQEKYFGLSEPVEIFTLQKFFKGGLLVGLNSELVLYGAAHVQQGLQNGAVFSFKQQELVEKVKNLPNGIK